MKERLVKPDADNKYYISKKNGGYNPCIIVANQKDNNGIVDPNLDVLANCVAYVTGRFNEALDLNECKYLGNKNARDYCTFAEEQGLTVTQDPVAGGVLVWGGKGKPMQHVEFVESVSADGNTAYTSSSAYGLYIFKRNVRKRNNGGQSNWGFQSKNALYLGCINPPLNKKIEQQEEPAESLLVEMYVNGIKYTGIVKRA